MTVESIDLRAIVPQAWKNGAGLTRELAFGGASASNFDWRISLAEVERDAPFSAFPGIDRCIVLLRGAGMRLHSADGAIDHALTTPLVPFGFPGEVALAATLSGGACSDFNVMTRRGVFRSDVSCARSGREFAGGEVTLLLGAAGAWRVETDEASTLPTLGPLHALLWREPVGRLRIEPRVGAAALIVVRLCHDRQP